MPMNCQPGRNRITDAGIDARDNPRPTASSGIDRLRPSADSSKPSSNVWRTGARGPRPAPGGANIPGVRSAPRARSRFAMFAQAIRSSRKAAACQMAMNGPARDRPCRWVKEARERRSTFVSGWSRRCVSMIDVSSARAAQPSRLGQIARTRCSSRPAGPATGVGQRERRPDFRAIGKVKPSGPTPTTSYGSPSKRRSCPQSAVRRRSGGSTAHDPVHTPILARLGLLARELAPERGRTPSSPKYPDETRNPQTVRECRHPRGSRPTTGTSPSPGRFRLLPPFAEVGGRRRFRDRGTNHRALSS